ncbi:two-component sensor histidine kinase BarA [Chimaeribacter coloradensis]|uniref:histidine kinase n=1 Tax=Chimaeribacter coloradensis TaxID=2060068 RepID=A0A2N5E9J2_9GAMM|nr:two-component sensor histidine kinase BarA [Chimaeribacter coloradensis]PLR38561.1 two-component sensor histidine kinase BarA [Chimaeribacter coloradensis]
MTKYSLRARMMVLILAPTLLIGLLLSTFFVVHRYNELQNQLVDSGASIIEPLAVASEYGMAFHNRESVRQLVSLLHRRHSDIVRSITVFDRNNRLFVTSNYHRNYSQLQISQGEPMPTELMLSRYGNELILRTPITAEESAPDETDNAVVTAAKPDNLGYIAIELDLNAVRLQQYKEVFVATLLLVLSLCIAILFAYRLMRDVTGPIRNMVNTVDRIRRGQLDSRVEGYMLGELDMLKNGINSMAMSLTAYHEEMQQNIDQATSDLRETLEQMEIQNVELDLAKKRAQEAARIKSEFLANMSHELRTPLNGVIGFTRQTLKTPLTPTQSDYLQTIERSANNLLTIINDVLDFSKLEAGKLVLEHIPFALRETLDEVVVLLAHTAHEKGLELTLNVQNNVPEQVIGDPLRLQQVVTNLLGNAVKFTESGNIDINVELRSHDNMKAELEVQIHDTGIGISERQQSQLFQAFRQADASISRRHGGTGLGLVITQKLVKEMGGDISFYSQLNRGSTFWFHINIELNDNFLPSAQPMETLQGKRLAYIEANDAAAKATLEILATTPLEVTHGTQLAQLPEEHFDILLIGVPLNKRHMREEYKARMPGILALADRVIMAVPAQLQIDAEALKKLGVQGCLIKPISSVRLLPLLLDDSQAGLLGNKAHRPPRLPLTVMAVDDNPANLKLIGTLLEELVEHTLLCDSGVDALALAREQQLDVILMDIQMPQIDGIRAAELIHQLPHHARTPIIAVTAHSLPGERESLLQAGMDDYLAKPIDEAMLKRVLARHHAPAATEPDAPPPLVSQASGEPLPSLDWALALRQSANKEDLANDLLQMLIDFLPQVSERVQAIVDGANDDAILALIHKLHGSCSYSGVPRLKQLCAYLEQQLRQNVSVQALEPEWLELLDEIENVTNAAKIRLRGA